MLPDYYLTDSYLPSKCASIAAHLSRAGDDGEAFIFITDMHWNKNARHSPELIAYLAKRLPIPRLFNGGDTEDAGLAPTAPCALRAAFSGDCFHVCGSHEYVLGVTEERVRDIYAHENVQFGDSLRNYFYTESDDVRYIVLNGSRSQNGNDGWKSVDGFEDEQYEWFISTALDTERTVVIFVHALYSMDQPTNTLRVMPGAHRFIDAIAAHDNIAAVFQGHAHRDRITFIGRVPVILTAGDMNVPWVDPIGISNIEVDRTTGTIREQSFDVCILNRRERRLDLVRIGGAALDSYGNPCEERSVKY